MEKKKIVVWDARWETKTPKRYDVEAWCLQGELGFRAFFYVDDMLYEAAGDDGYWYVLYTMHKAWLNKFKEVVNAIE
jgi:hypothetical protein